MGIAAAEEALLEVALSKLLAKPVVLVKGSQPPPRTSQPAIPVLLLRKAAGDELQLSASLAMAQHGRGNSM